MAPARALAALVVVIALVYSASAATAGTCVSVTPQNINVYSAPCSGAVTAVVRGGTGGVLTTTAVPQCNQYWATVAFTNGVVGFVSTDGLAPISCVPQAQHTNAAALALIESFVPLTTSWTLNGYVRNGKKFNQIGYNHRLGSNSPYKPGSTITQPEAASQLQSDLQQIEVCLLANIRVPVTSNQFSAMVSYSYDTAPNVLSVCQSGKDAPLIETLNTGKYSTVCALILASAGNAARRSAECNLFST